MLSYISSPKIFFFVGFSPCEISGDRYLYGCRVISGSFEQLGFILNTLWMDKLILLFCLASRNIKIKFVTQIWVIYMWFNWNYSSSFVFNFWFLTLSIFSEAMIFFLFLFCFVLFCFWDRVSLCSFGACPRTSSCRPGWSRTHRDLPAAASWVLRLKVCAATYTWPWFLF